MPITFHPKTPVHGLCLKSGLEGEEVEVCTRANFTSEDGTQFLFHIEAIWDFFGRQVNIPASQVDHFLAILSPDGSVTIYCNELLTAFQCRAKGAIDAGQQVTKDHIAEIKELRFCTQDNEAIELPADCGVITVHSHEWRKAVFYDLGPLSGENRTISVGHVLGQQMSAMMFHEFYAVGDEQWSRMMYWGWFPFIGLGDDDRKRVISFSVRETEARGILEEVCQNYRLTIQQRLESWNPKGVLQEHIPFLEAAHQRLLENDFITSISTLYPRIEGVMRGLDLLENPEENTGQGKMVDNLVRHVDEYSLLLPSRFRQYLRRFYFRNFNYRDGELPLSRHTQGHGLSRAEDYDLVNATLGFLIFDQLFYYLHERNP